MENCRHAWGNMEIIRDGCCHGFSLGNCRCDCPSDIKTFTKFVRTCEACGRVESFYVDGDEWIRKVEKI